MKGPKHKIHKICPGLKPAFHRDLVKEVSRPDRKIGTEEHDIVNRRLGIKEYIRGFYLYVST